MQRGAALLVRLNPFSVVLSDAQGQPLSVDALKRQKTETIRTLEVVITSADGEDQVRGWVHAYRLNPEQAGRPGKNAVSAIKKAPRKRRGCIWQVGWWSLPHCPLRCFPPRPSWRFIAVAGKWKSR